MSATPCVRFAPSPTGYLHPGNARTAVINYLFARKHNGRFCLRIDDTDATRVREEYVAAIEEDLHWLGLSWDTKARQSERAELYEEAVEKLKASGMLYPCYETPEELARKRALARKGRGGGVPPVYDRAALALSASERAALEAEGRQPHWRFRLSGKPVVIDDMLRGRVVVQTTSLSDPVLRRADGAFLYMLPSVVDDAALGITHVIRGDDHLTNAAVQNEIAEALGATPPRFAHHPLLVEAGGARLSKRKGAGAVRELREAGFEAPAVLGALVHAPDDATTEDAFLSAFTLEGIGRGAAQFDTDALWARNAHLVHAMAYESVAPRLKAMGIGGGADFWTAVRGNLRALADAEIWWRIIAEPLTPIIAPRDKALMDAARRLLPPPPHDAETWARWTKALAEELGGKYKGRALYLPLRLALTGRREGPEMAKLLPLIGHDAIRARLAG